MKACYGQMMPAISDLDHAREVRGKVFSVRCTSSGFGHRSMAMNTDMTAWEDCLACEFYASCYDLSLAQVQLQAVITRQG